jgi:hypothetical protein
MNPPPPRYPGAAPEPAADDLSIPVLTERLGLPPLEFDTTLPLIETTGQMSEPMLEGLTALPEPPLAYTPPPPGSTEALHPIAALPFPPIAFPEEIAPASAAPLAAPTPPAPATLATNRTAPAAPAAFLRPMDTPPVMPVAPVAPAAAAAPPPAAPVLPQATPTADTASPAAARAASGGQHWGRIELELRSSILRQITEQLPREIDGIVQGRMQEAIDRLLRSLAEEIHLAVTASLGDIVERAVRAELDRMRNSNRG